MLKNAPGCAILNITSLRGDYAMDYTLSDSCWKRFFSVPCALVDNYLKLADGPALKVFLYLISCEGKPDDNSIMSATGLSRESFEDAVMFWKELGVISSDGIPTQSDNVTVPADKPDSPALPSETNAKVVHARYAPKDIAVMLKADQKLMELFTEAEKTLGRILKHADHETLISLRDYYGFDEPSIVLILSYCFGLGKTSARYYETVAKGLFEQGITDFHAIETEFEKKRQEHSFENELRRDFGLETRPTTRQTEYIRTWRNMGFDIGMISLAREKCVDNTNKLSFPYIDKILHSWAEKGIFTPEATCNDTKPPKAQPADRSFDIDEFENFTLTNKKEESK